MITKIKIRRYWFGDRITKLEENEIFVFGSNPEGRHGRGAAKAALSFGAKYGVGRGLCGKSYALVTKNLKPNYYEKSTGIKYGRYGNRSVPKSFIKDNILELYECANNNINNDFLIPYKSSDNNLNGYSFYEIKDMFLSFDVPENIIFHESWKTFNY